MSIWKGILLFSSSLTCLKDELAYGNMLMLLCTFALLRVAVHFELLSVVRLEDVNTAGQSTQTQQGASARVVGGTERTRPRLEHKSEGSWRQGILAIMENHGWPLGCICSKLVRANPAHFAEDPTNEPRVTLRAGDHERHVPVLGVFQRSSDFSALVVVFIRI
jgi:hypothetical protein